MGSVVREVEVAHNRFVSIFAIFSTSHGPTEFERQNAILCVIKSAVFFLTTLPTSAVESL